MVLKKQKEVSLIIGLKTSEKQKTILIKAITELKNLFSVEQASPLVSSKKELFASIHIRTQLPLTNCVKQLIKTKKLFEKNVLIEIVYYGQKLSDKKIKIPNPFFSKNAFFIKSLSKILPDFREPLTNKKICRLI